MVNTQKTLLGICPGKVFFCVKNFKKVLANTSNTMYNKDKDKGVIKRSTYHEQVWRIFKKRKRISID